jgi:hypothetical protein
MSFLLINAAPNIIINPTPYFTSDLVPIFVPIFLTHFVLVLGATIFNYGFLSLLSLFYVIWCLN